MAYSVFLIDDEEWALKDMMISFPWKKYGFEVAGCYTDSVLACEMMEKAPPHVVVTDIRMPRLTGTDLLRRVREKGIESAFVLVSAVSDFDAARMAIRYSAVEYCLKPLDEAECEKTVRRLREMLEQGGAHKEETAASVSPQMQEILSFIAQSIQNVTIQDISDAAHLSVNSLQRLFKKEMDITCGQYLENYRMERACRMLEDGQLYIGEISDRLGYNNQNYFAFCFRRHFGVSPAQWRKEKTAGRDGEK